ncbi:hypothetical protein [Thermostichus vulcanus]|uniref:Uncharacterized protein n=1 Tax=Thermostichus vulcanus str. 'Rupite' TaxID=2813851 RepID=A0ABT0C6Y9_THEVL|nr:hypothetical protein [Thermostichus vulcanus]MCJ2541553.1 hypothetical protein [Thermostichus vulcanus str. 'Rupite']
MATWVHLQPQSIKCCFSQDLKPQLQQSPDELAQKLRADEDYIRSERIRLRHLNRILVKKRRKPIKLPTYRWTSEHALSLTAKVVPLLLGTTVACIFDGTYLAIAHEGSDELSLLRVSGRPNPFAHLVLDRPPKGGKRLPLLLALSQLLKHPLKPEVVAALRCWQRLRAIYPAGSLVRDRQMHQLFQPEQLHSLVQLQFLTHLGRHYRLR